MHEHPFMNMIDVRACVAENQLYIAKAHHTTVSGFYTMQGRVALLDRVALPSVQDLLPLHASSVPGRAVA